MKISVRRKETFPPIYLPFLNLALNEGTCEFTVSFCYSQVALFDDTIPVLV